MCDQELEPCIFHKRGSCPYRRERERERERERDTKKERERKRLKM